VNWKILQLSKVLLQFTEKGGDDCFDVIHGFAWYIQDCHSKGGIILGHLELYRCQNVLTETSACVVYGIIVQRLRKFYIVFIRSDFLGFTVIGLALNGDAGATFPYYTPAQPGSYILNSSCN
jgi:hypothetical protein